MNANKQTGWRRSSGHVFPVSQIAPCDLQAVGTPRALGTQFNTSTPEDPTLPGPGVLEGWSHISGKCTD